MAIKALLMDFYGTLVRENDGLVRDFARRICEASPLALTPGDVANYWWEATSSLYREHCGAAWRSLVELEEKALGEVVERFEAHIEPGELVGEIVQSWQRPEAYSDTRVFMSRLPLPVCAVANADRDIMAAALAYAQLEVQAAVTSEDAKSYKPDLGIFYHALKVMGVKAGEALYVGDSIYYDIQPAQKAGMFTAWVNRSGRPLGGRSLPDVTCDNLQQLRSMIK
jgi:2-haloacid dehalogenase/putative hydrolase of the HAD superfamily